MPEQKQDKSNSLTSFQIKNAVSPQIHGFSKAKNDHRPLSAEEKNKLHEKASLGFPTLEAFVESETLDTIAVQLQPSFEKLEKLESESKGEIKTAAIKAIQAFELTADLLDYLFETKKKLEENQK